MSLRRPPSQRPPSEARSSRAPRPGADQEYAAAGGLALAGHAARRRLAGGQQVEQHRQRHEGHQAADHRREDAELAAARPGQGRERPDRDEPRREQEADGEPTRREHAGQRRQAQGDQRDERDEERLVLGPEHGHGAARRGRRARAPTTACPTASTGVTGSPNSPEASSAAPRPRAPASPPASAARVRRDGDPLVPGRRLIPAGPRSTGPARGSAWPRWLIASFSAGVSSAVVRARARRARRSGRSRSRRCRAARGSAWPSSWPSPTTLARRRAARARPRTTKCAPRRSSGTSASWAEQQVEVGAVVAVPAGPARRQHARHAVERVDAQPGVVGDRRQPGGRGDRRAP